MSDIPRITRAARCALEFLRKFEDHEELVCEGGDCWYGLYRTNRQVVNQLISLCLISESVSGGIENYHINEAGKRLLDGLPPYRDSEGRFHNTIHEVLMAVVHDDRIQHITGGSLEKMYANRRAT